MDPLVALVRIVYLLDRAHAPGPKAKAFVRTAEVVRATPRAELERLAKVGALTSLESIGDSSARIITQCLAGKIPDYLTDLEQSSRVDAEGGAELLTRIRGDCHSHSTWSDGGWPIEAMARSARAIGHEYLTVTDHSSRLTIAHGLSRERLVQQIEEIEVMRERLAPLRILTGMEVDILEDGSLDLDDDMLGRLDVVVASVHSKFTLPVWQMTNRLVKAASNPHVDILGHCTNRILEGRGRPPSQFDAANVFAACAANKTAVEINSRPERLDPPDELIEVARDQGCLFAIDSDAHAPGQLEWQGYGCAKAHRAGIQADRIITTWPAERLLDWCRSAH